MTLSVGFLQITFNVTYINTNQGLLLPLQKKERIRE